jgi:hypothetical protein
MTGLLLHKTISVAYSTYLQVELGSMTQPPLDCPIKTALWQHYRQRNPNGLTLPPKGAEDYEHPDIAEYCEHIATCVECNLV